MDVALQTIRPLEPLPQCAQHEDSYDPGHFEQYGERKQKGKAPDHERGSYDPADIS